MLSVVIGTLNHERALVPTLSSLVAGATAGMVREVIVADGGSSDATAEVADIAGCNFVTGPSPLAPRLRAAVAQARAPWLMLLRPGAVLSPSWVDDCAHFAQQAELQAALAQRAAAFRLSPGSGESRGPMTEALKLLYAAIGHALRPEQGLILHRQLYDRLGGHRNDKADPESDLATRIGRQNITLLRSKVFIAAVR